MFSSLLQQLNQEMDRVVAAGRRSLVEVQTEGIGGGAGTIWHPDGLVLTNAHVATRPYVRVVLPDGSARPGRVLARDSALDIAALVVDAGGLTAIELGDSQGLQPGHWVVALGHPWGVAGAAAAGVVIGAGRDLPELPASDREWIAVGLPLRPGNSGGPLLDAQGRLVGINTMMAGPQVGMAVPVHLVKAFLRRELGRRSGSAGEAQVAGRA